MTRKSKRELILLVILAVAACFVLYRAFNPKDELADLKEMAPADIPGEAEEVLKEAMASMETGDMDALYELMANPDGIAFQGRYADGLFADGGTGPLERIGEVKRLVKTSVPNVIVQLRDQQNRVYSISLIRKEETYKISGITPVKQK